MYIIYGISNCDTIKKTLNWLEKHRIPFTFHNYKTEGITQARLQDWCSQVGWEIVLNKKSTTWRGLDTAIKEKQLNQKEAVKLMATHTSLIKRPVIEKEGRIVTVGFDEARYREVFL